MQIDIPSWQIKKLCPCCEQGYPIFIICPDCSYLTLKCEETGDTFLHPFNLETGFAEKCPMCKTVNTADFILATSEQLLNAGFTKDEYK